MRNLTQMYVDEMSVDEMSVDETTRRRNDPSPSKTVDCAIIETHLKGGKKKVRKERERKKFLKQFLHL
jgi:hypothetical protein